MPNAESAIQTSINIRACRLQVWLNKRAVGRDFPHLKINYFHLRFYFYHNPLESIIPTLSMEFKWLKHQILLKHLTYAWETIRLQLIETWQKFPGFKIFLNFFRKQKIKIFSEKESNSAVTPHLWASDGVNDSVAGVVWKYMSVRLNYYFSTKSITTFKGDDSDIP